ncbi:MAG: DUF1987 domain-containing protein [Bacteroidales bacterium]
MQVEGTEHTPDVILDEEQGLISLRGYSLPENTGNFYYPILEWLTNYLNKAPEVTTVKFDLEYFNSSSFKMLLELIQLISNLKEKGKQLNITWSYQQGDDDILDSGRQLEELLGIEFEYICYK